MAAEPPEVIQGRLGWESGDISEAKPEELEPHPKNKEIYGDTEDAADLDATFKESVAEKGVLEPLVITEGKQIISGHRRWLAANEAGLEKVPVRYAEFDSELAEREALIEFNRQRKKTDGQIVNEYEEQLAIERIRANLNKSNKTTGGDEGSSGAEDLSEDGDRATRRAANKLDVGYSADKLEKGREIKRKAKEGDDTAKEQWERLERGETSIQSAAKQVEESEGSRDIDQFTSQKTDEWSSPRNLVEPIDEAIGGFDLDPCSGAENSPFATEVFTEDDDGLAQDWFGRVWVNPPYSAMDGWVEKAVSESQREDTDTIVFLCKGDSSTKWWQNAVREVTCVIAIDGRLSFGDGGNSAPFASHLLVFGDVSDELADELGRHGTVLTVGWCE